MKIPFKISKKILIISIISTVFYSCEANIKINDVPENATSFLYSESYINGVDLRIADCKQNHHILCEFEGSIQSRTFVFDMNGQPYPINFLLKDEGICEYSPSLALYIPVDCSAADGEYVQGTINCYDETEGGTPIVKLQSGNITFSCL